jgi:adenine-specific DNA-methyltransferase
MDKMRMESLNMTEQNVEKIAALFPNCITETKDEHGKPKKAVNFEMLKQMLSDGVIDGDEAYEFSWVGKKASIVEANKPVRKTLRPCKEESVNWDSTENLYIEGDNLDVLKLLQESYLGAVRVIFIDPPYNTGHDFVYPDSFIMDNEEYNEGTGYFDEDGNVNYKRENSSAAGKYHSDWLSMMYSRLKLASNLLAEDGIIFITLDDNENANMRLLANEIFGESNFIAEFTWEKKKKPSFLHRNVGKVFDYVICYAKNASVTTAFSVETTTLGKKYPFNNAGNGRATLVFPPETVEILMPDQTVTAQDMSGGNIYTVLKKDLIIKNHRNANELVLEGEWRYSQDKVNELIAGQEPIVISKIPFRPNLVKTGGEVKKMKNVLSPTSYSCETNEDATAELEALFGKGNAPFDTPKPVGLIKLLIQAITYDTQDGIILDFFAGSGTTAHAVMELNTEDNGTRQFIMVQVPEPCEENSIGYKNGFSNVSDICKERIRRASKQIAKEHSDCAFDGGFRVLKLDDTNMKDVYYSADEYDQGMLKGLESNIKDDRTDLDLLFGCLLEWGLPLSLPYTSEQIDGCTVHTYNGGDLIACFNQNVPESVIKIIAKRQPLRVVFRDSSFMNSPAKINIGEIFKLMAPDTRIKVI